MSCTYHTINFIILNYDVYTKTFLLTKNNKRKCKTQSNKNKMITNLFSVFDPSSAILSISWIIIPITPLLIIKNKWILNSPSIKTYSQILFAIKKEVKFTLGKTEVGSELIIIIAFITIIFINFVGLYPQIFSVTTHLTITLPLSLIFWLRLIIFGWSQNTNPILSHLLPQGTPGALMSFMVLIELTSNIIRPITLCVRLTANLIAGHLLMSLLGNFLVNTSIIIVVPLVPIPILLTILERAVPCIQAYVFITLITLYTTETK